VNTNIRVDIAAEAKHYPAATVTVLVLIGSAVMETRYTNGAIAMMMVAEEGEDVRLIAVVPLALAKVKHVQMVVVEHALEQCIAVNQNHQVKLVQVMIADIRKIIAETKYFAGPAETINIALPVNV
jgi:hypothetical protein